MSEYKDYIMKTYPRYWGILREYVCLNFKDIILLIHYLPNILSIYNVNKIYIWENKDYTDAHSDVDSIIKKYNSRINVLTVLQTFKMKYLSEYKDIETHSINERKVFLQLGNRITAWWYELDYFMINLPVPDVKWFKNLINKMSIVPQVRRNVLDTDMLVSVAGDILKYKTICQVMKIPYIERTQDERMQIIYDFTSIPKYKFGRNKLYSALKKKLLHEERYTRLVNYAEDQYNARIINKVKNNLLQNKFKYAQYIYKDVPNKECNKYYIENNKDGDIHPDIYTANVLMKDYLQVMKFRSSEKEWDLCYSVIVAKYSHKTLLLRNIIKDTMEDYTKEMKELGFISLYNFEIIFGYRCDNISDEEIQTQISKNYLGKNYEFGEIQREFFKKYFQGYINWRNVGKTIQEAVVTRNTRRGAINDKIQFYSAAGSSQVKQDTTKGSKVMSKTQFFYTVQDFNQIEKQLGNNTRNNVIIKKELVKQRIVVNTALNTYMPLTRIVANLNDYFSGTLYNYGLMTKTQKAEMYSRICKYLVHNECVNEDYIMLPLDYSSFDTTITKELICETLRSFSSITPNEEIVQDIKMFEDMLEDTHVTYNDKEYKYKYGVLSGWKITNIVESLLNAVISFGVCQELNLNIVDILTMGDDLLMVVKGSNYTNIQLVEILAEISEKYKSLGFQVHPTKNMISYRFAEFLRNTYYSTVVQPYPLRSMISIYYRQPTSTIEVINYSSYKSNIDKMIMRTGSYSQKNFLYRKYFSKSQRQNIRVYGYKFFINPKDFKLLTENKYDYVTKYTDKEIMSMYSYKFLSTLFGNKFNNYVVHYIKYSVLSGKIPIENIVPRTDSKKKKMYYDRRLKFYIESFFSNLKFNSKFVNFNLDSGSYAVNEILVAILEHEKMKFSEQKDLLISVFDNYYGVVKRMKYSTSLTISLLSKKQQIIEMLKSYRLTQNYNYYNNIIASRIKERLYNYLIFKYLTKRQRFTNKVKMGLLNYYLLGSFLKNYSVALLVSETNCVQLSVNVD